MKSTVLPLILLLAVPHVALAQPAETPAAPAPAPVAPIKAERHGLFAGGALTGGNISCDGMDCGGFREAGGGALQVGYMLSPRFGLLLDVWAMTSSQNDVSITFVTSTVNARYWLANTIWVQGGLGHGHAQVRLGGLSARASDDVPVAQLAAGLELVRGRQWALDVHAKLAQGSSTDADGDEVATGRSAGFGVNFTYYAMR